MTKEESEYGSGLAICLVKFAEHFENRWAMQIYHVHGMRDHLDDQEYLSRYDRETQEDVREFNLIYRQTRGSVEAGLSHMIELWANGASDHLYDMKVPEKWAKTELGKQVQELREKGLAMGHGFTGKTWIFEQFIELKKLTREIALKLDIGLWAMMGEKTQLDIGRW